MEIRLIPHLLAARKHILPANLTIPARQNISMHACAVRHTPQTRRLPLARPYDPQLHLPLHGLRDAELPAQELHLQVLLLGAPLCEPGFERVEGLRGGCGGGGVCVGWAGGFRGGTGEGEVRAQGVVDARGGGGAGGGGGGLSGRVGCGDYLEGLESLLLGKGVGLMMWQVAYHRGGGGLAGWDSVWVDGLGEMVRFCLNRVEWLVWCGLINVV